MRFRPPPWSASPALRWVLRAAYADDAPVESAPPGVVELAARLDLAARLAVRLDELAPRLDRRSIVSLLALRTRVQERERAALRTIARAREAGDAIPFVLVKGAALRARGVVPSGGRRVGDVDVLVPEAESRDLGRRLLAAGFRQMDFPESDHAHAPFALDDGVPLDLHHNLPGLEPATWDGLRKAGLLDEVHAGIFVPGRDILAAHAAVHGVVQHGAAPQTYPHTCVFADLLDLAGPDSARDILARAARYVAVPDLDLAGLAATCDRLRNGDVDESDPLLGHGLMGLLHPPYGISLKTSRLPRTARAALHAVVMTNAQIDAVYGRGSRARRIALRLLRPLDLVRRTVRSLAARRLLAARQEPVTLG